MTPSKYVDDTDYADNVREREDAKKLDDNSQNNDYCIIEICFFRHAF